MIVTIDTGKDSREDILKAIALLRAVVQEGQASNVFSDNPPAAPSALGSFFDAAEQAPSTASAPVPDALPKDEPKVEFY